MDLLNLKEILKGIGSTGGESTRKGIIKVYNLGKATTPVGKDYLKCNIEDCFGNTYIGSIWGYNGLTIEETGTYVECVVTAKKLGKPIFWNLRDCKVLETTEDLITKFNGSKLDTLDISMLLDELTLLVNSISDVTIRDFISYTFNRLGLNDSMDLSSDDKISWTASNGHHHNYNWGVVEHIVSVTNRAIDYGKTYNKINMDLVIAGALLHDYGKLLTYDKNKGDIVYTLEGRLLDHLLIGISELQRIMCEYKATTNVNEEIDKLDNLLLYLQGISASHRGHKDYGSLCNIFCLESLVVSQADMGDFIEYAYREACTESSDAIVNIGELRFIHRDKIEGMFN